MSRRTDDRTPRGREILRSRDNARLKRVGAVRAGKERDTLLLEGERLVADALEAGVALELVLVAADRPDLLARFDERAHVDLVEPELLARGGQDPEAPDPTMTTAAAHTCTGEAKRGVCGGSDELDIELEEGVPGRVEELPLGRKGELDHIYRARREIPSVGGVEFADRRTGRHRQWDSSCGVCHSRWIDTFHT